MQKKLFLASVLLCAVLFSTSVTTLVFAEENDIVADKINTVADTVTSHTPQFILIVATKMENIRIVSGKKLADQKFVYQEELAHSGSKTKFEQLSSYIPFYFFTIFSVIVNSVILFYVFSVFVLFIVLRFIWRKVF